MEQDKRGTYFVQSLERGLTVIRAFDAEHPELTLSDVARRTGLSRAAARRFLLTLTDLGYVRCDGRRFTLTARVLELGFSYLSSLSLAEVALPHLERLSTQVGESSSVSVLDGDDIVYVARVPTTRIMTVAINVGTRFPAWVTSMGRVMLADLDPEVQEQYLARVPMVAFTSRTIDSVPKLRQELRQVQQQGWCVVDQELEDGLRSAAAPIREAHGPVLAAINVSAQASRYTAQSIRDLLPAVLAAAAMIEADLAVAGGQAAGHRSFGA